MKVLITGASGLLGRRVFKRLKGLPNFDAVGSCFSRIEDKDLIKLDITDRQCLEQWFLDNKPAAVVHCAAERRPNIVDNNPSLAYSLNVKATQDLCDLAERFHCWLLYISTDYVFDGKNAPYSESDSANPLNTYGKHKLAGEEIVLSAAGGQNAVLRVPILYGPIEYLGESAVTILYDRVRDVSTSCSMDDRQRRYPTHTDTVAEVIHDMLIKHQEQLLTGVYHLTDTQMLTKYNMALAMADVMQHPTAHIKASKLEPSSSDTPRPYDCHLHTDRLRQVSIPIPSRDFRTEIKRILTENLMPGA